MVKKFNPGDKVFAKVRGYPPWPAQVNSIVDLGPNKLKYHVTFFGTLETAICKVEDIYPYAENKEKYGKPLKRKGFNEALAEIEGAPSIPYSNIPLNSSDDDISSDIDSEIGTPPKSKIKYERKNFKSSVKAAKIKDVVTSDINTDDSTIIKFAEDLSSLPFSSVCSAKPLIVSRSGRKIKPKKFADEDSSCTSPESAKILNDTLKNTNGNEKANWKSEVHSDICEHKSEEESESKEILKVKDDESSECSSTVKTSLNKKIRLKLNVRKGDYMPVNRQQHYIAVFPLVKKVGKLKHFQTECRMLELDALIKSCFFKDNINLEKCIHYLTDLSNLSLNCRMLRRYPQVVSTIRKLSLCVDRSEYWNFSESEKFKLKKKVGIIRTKSIQLYNRFKTMFILPEKDLAFSASSGYKILSKSSVSAENIAQSNFNTIEDVQTMS